MQDHHRLNNRLLAVIAGLLLVAALKWSYSVTMPLAAAVFVVAVVWPIKLRLDRHLPSWLSYGGTIVLLLLVFAGFVFAMYFSTAQVVQTLVARQAQFEQLYNSYAGWAEANGLPVILGSGGGYTRLVSLMQTVLSSTYTVLAYLGSIAILVFLGLPEVPAFQRKVRDHFDAADRREVLDAVEETAGRFRSYIGVTIVTSLLTGIASALWAAAMGLDLALTWGVLNFLLNFIPVAGNIIGIIPPTIYALLQFQNWTMPLFVFLGYAVMQIGISNFIYPWLQGRGLSLSPVAIVVALAFWGWVWGIAGVLLAVPLTAALAIACAHFRGTEWITKLVSKA
nr:AI-2E family transporter [Falsiroseomonas tokyonensis]